MPLKIFISAPLFTVAEREFNRKLAEGLTAAGYAVLLPQDRCKPVHGDLEAVFQQCLSDLDDADLIVAVLDGPDVDSGTSFEVGYAFAKNKPVIGIRTDFRTSQGDGPNVMLRYSLSYIGASAMDASMNEILPDVVQAIKSFEKGHSRRGKKR